MIFVKINAALMSVIIYLLLKSRFGSSVGGSGPIDRLKSIETSRLNPSALSGQKNPNFSSLVLTEQKICTREIRAVFSEDGDLRDYIKYSILNLTLHDQLTYYAKKYYMTFYQHILIGDVQTVAEYCQIVTADFRESCKQSINSFLLLGPNDRPYNPIYYNTINHRTLKDIVIEPAVMLFNALYYLTDSLARKAHQDFAFLYMELISKNFELNPAPLNAEPFRKPFNYCRWLLDKQSSDYIAQLHSGFSRPTV